MLIGLCVGVGLVVIMAVLALALAIKSRKGTNANDYDGFYDDYAGGEF